MPAISRWALIQRLEVYFYYR